MLEVLDDPDRNGAVVAAPMAWTFMAIGDLTFGFWITDSAWWILAVAWMVASYILYGLITLFFGKSPWGFGLGRTGV